jgi:predicted small metal-binding protein
MMLIKYACKDMGLNCPFIVKDEALAEVIKKALAHVQEKHAAEFNNISSPAEIEQMELALARITRVVAG